MLKKYELFFILFLGGLPGCGHRILRPLTAKQAQFSQEKDGIELRVKRLCLIKGLRVVQVSLINNGTADIFLGRDDISCKTYRVSELIRLFNRKSMNIDSPVFLVGLGALSLIGLPTLAILCGGGALVLVCCPLFPFFWLALPFVDKGARCVGGHVRNREVPLSSDYYFLKAHALTRLNVLPGERADRVIVLDKSDANFPFVCSVHKGDKALEFNVKV
jgi:hypothetical protein